MSDDDQKYDPAKAGEDIFEKGFVRGHEVGYAEAARRIAANLPLTDEPLDHAADTIPIEEMGFTSRTFNTLRRYEILTAGKLFDLADEKLMELRGFGKITLKEVNDKRTQYQPTAKPPTT